MINQKALSKLKEKINEQAMDEGLWFNAETVTEAYLQRELRELTRLIENAIEDKNNPK